MSSQYIRWWDDTNEQNLLHDLIDEAINLHGIDVVYLPRIMRREDVLYSEDVLSQFTETFPLTVYLKDVQGSTGPGNFLSKFGLNTDLNFSVMLSVRRFQIEVHGVNRPTEGDLLYIIPLKRVFEIKFVESEQGPGQFYPLGAKTFWELNLESYTVTHEEIRTGEPEIDLFEGSLAYAIDLLVAAGGTGEYIPNEIVYQGASPSTTTASGTVASWNANTATLRLTSIVGSFANDVAVVGASSGATHVLGEAPDVLEIPNDAMDDNRYLIDQARTLFDSSEHDPLEGC